MSPAPAGFKRLAGPGETQIEPVPPWQACMPHEPSPTTSGVKSSRMRIGGLPMEFLLATALAATAHSLWLTLFPVFLDERGFQLWEVGVASGLTYALTFISALPAGLASDAASTRAALVASSLIQLASLHAVANAPSAILLIPLLVIYSFSLAVRGQAAVRLVATLSGRGDRAFKYSLYLLATGLANALGSYLSGLVAEEWGYMQLFSLSEFLLLASALAALGIKGAPRGRLPGLRAIKQVALSREMVLLTSSLSIHDFSVFMCMPYVALFQKKVVGITPYQIGVLSAMTTATSQLAQLAAGAFADKFGARASLALHYTGVSAGYALVALSKNFEELALAALVQGLSMPFDMPARRKLLTLIASPEVIATSSGLADTVVGIATLPSPILGSYLWGYASPRAMMLCGAAMNLMALLPLNALERGRS